MYCYAVARRSVTCSRNLFLLRRNQKMMRLFPATAPLRFVAIDLPGQLLRTPRGNDFLLVIRDRYSKLVRNVRLKSITARTVVKAFVTHSVLIYGPLRWLFS